MTVESHTTDAATAASLPALVYKGEIIHERREMLSLTDMWKAAGSPEDRRPAEWLRSADAMRFIDALRLMGDMGNSHTDLVETKKGGPRQGTWAHWQIALAYAKYLSPEFHMWCNTVVRERMEQRSTALLPAAIAARIERTYGIARQLSHRLKVLQDAVADLQERQATPALDFGGTVSAHQMIEMAGVAAKSRQRGTTQMVTNRMLAFCAGRRVACIRTPAIVNPSEPYRFPHALACEWLLGDAKGAEIIRNQVERARAKKARRGAGTAQAAFQLVPTNQPAR